MKNKKALAILFFASFSGLSGVVEKEVTATQDKKPVVQLAQAAEKRAYTADQESLLIKKEPYVAVDDSAHMCEKCPPVSMAIDQCCLKVQQALESHPERPHPAEQEYTVGCICGLLFVEKLITCGLC